mmetsp:Transcript_7354/g.11523  ORF Transcript_7354/g.11523 Transcript_7354/m.11523 type:complete len:123 (+) Transcript_7354:3826-4194(+)
MLLYKKKAELNFQALTVLDFFTSLRRKVKPDFVALIFSSEKSASPGRFSADKEEEQLRDSLGPLFEDLLEQMKVNTLTAQRGMLESAQKTNFSRLEQALLYHERKQQMFMQGLADDLEAKLK